MCAYISFGTGSSSSIGGCCCCCNTFRLLRSRRSSQTKEPMMAIAAAQPTPIPAPAPAESADEEFEGVEADGDDVCAGVASVFRSLVVNAAVKGNDVAETDVAVEAADKMERLSTDHVDTRAVLDRTAGS